MAVRVRGKVVSMIADRAGTYFTLDNDVAEGPKENQWLLKVDHGNYNALYSLLLAAAANRWRLIIRIEGDEEVSVEREAAVKSIGINFT